MYLKKLKLFHLHSNQLTGDADYFEQSLESFIADCGNTDLTEKIITCTTCTECCNDEGGCITLEKTWPNYNLESIKTEYNVSPAFTIIFIILACWIVLLFTSFVMSFWKEKLPPINYPLEEFQQNSIYRFFLGNNKFGIFVALLTTLFQVTTTFTFFAAGDTTSTTNDWAYTVR